MDQSDRGTLARLDAREVRKSEPDDFTPWLRENAALLGEAIGSEAALAISQTAECPEEGTRPLHPPGTRVAR
jgi:hypothetical protein